MAKVILDAGHGGEDPGAVYEGRQEKDDNLRLVLAVGDVLEDNGVEVAFTRTEDVYNTPLEKAQIANAEGGDLFVSIHRNSSPLPNQYSGAETLVYDQSGEKAELARAINEELAGIGFRNLGVSERPGLIVLRRTEMPAVLAEVGFLNTEADNILFEEQFEAIADGIASAILQTLHGMESPENANHEDRISDDAKPVSPDFTDIGRIGAESTGSVESENRIYRVQVGAFKNRAYAEELLYQLLQQNFPVCIHREDGFYKVQVGAFVSPDNAIRMEAALRRRGFSTFLVLA